MAALSRGFKPRICLLGRGVLAAEAFACTPDCIVCSRHTMQHAQLQCYTVCPPQNCYAQDRATFAKNSTVSMGWTHIVATSCIFFACSNLRAANKQETFPSHRNSTEKVTTQAKGRVDSLLSTLSTGS